MDSMIFANAVLSRVPEVTCAELDNEVVLMNSATAKYYTLTGTAKSIWNLLEPSTTFNAVCDELSKRYDVEADACRNDVTRFLEGMYKQGLVMVRLET